MKILLLNCGGSSVKFRLFEKERQELLVSGLVEGIGSQEAALIFRAPGKKERKTLSQVQNQEQAIDVILKALCDPEHGSIESIYEIDTVGHHIIHGGEEFSGSILIDEAVFLRIKEWARNAPLHNSYNIEGIKASLWLLPLARQIAVFDTDVDQSMEALAFVHPIL